MSPGSGTPESSRGRVPASASAARRRDDRRTLLGPSFEEADLAAVLDLLALMDLAWHDCYGESCPPDAVVDDVMTIARNDLTALARAAYLAVVDFRDARVEADALRREGAG